MKTGFRGTFVISWSQTEVDGQSAPLEALTVGATWAWHGEATRVDGPNDVLRLGMAEAEAELRRRAARKVRCMVGAVLENRTDIADVEITEPLMDRCFVVTDGAASFTATVIDVAPGRPPLLMFLDELPPRGRELWVVHRSLGAFGQAEDAGKGVICFTPGTMISTPAGPRLVEELCEGDKVLTRDSGPEEVLWVGTRRMTGARMYVQPRLRPIRIGAGALGTDRPDSELLVSPGHRMLVRGPAARALFNTPEVLVPAADLVNGTSITVDLSAREVTYIHLLLPSHHVLWANGVECESFHPGDSDLDSLGEVDRIP